MEKQIHDVKEIMVENIGKYTHEIGLHNATVFNVCFNAMLIYLEKVLERGEMFDLLVDRTDKLHRNSVKFERSATKLRKTVWRRNVKLWALLVFVGLVREP